MRVLLLISLFSVVAFSLKGQKVNWLSFEQLDSAIAAEPKPVLVEFYTSWCAYCKKMEQESFNHPEIIKELAAYYVVRFDAESKEAVLFDGLNYSGVEGQRFHPIVNLLATRKNSVFAPPVLVFLNKDMRVEGRSFAYMSRAELKKSLRSFSNK
ncbi:thioredoxin family protein [Roseivirga pacifica]|uniref:thioredoxin family protein n=1 Tax=Roseivirga pacifica TaxID=1267423 RepID=UPI00227A1FF6|nr:thioredoxin fold domain-containing protein [Roseivirga pacifica]